MGVQQANQYTHYRGEDLKGEERMKETENLFENIMAKTCKFKIYMYIHIKESQQTSQRINLKTATLYIILKLLNVKRQIEP